MGTWQEHPGLTQTEQEAAVSHIISLRDFHRHASANVNSLSDRTAAVVFIWMDPSPSDELFLYS